MHTQRKIQFGFLTGKNNIKPQAIPPQAIKSRGYDLPQPIMALKNDYGGLMNAHLPYLYKDQHTSFNILSKPQNRILFLSKINQIIIKYNFCTMISTVLYAWQPLKHVGIFSFWEKIHWTKDKLNAVCTHSEKYGLVASTKLNRFLK